MIPIWWSFMGRLTAVEAMLGLKVAYSWKCPDPEGHDHTILCLWIWHECDLNLNPVPDHWTHMYTGWQPTGVSEHILVNSNPLHIEASVYWPECCGMHGWIRDGQWIPV